MSLKQYNFKEELTEEDLVNDLDFIDDASMFLHERQGLDKVLSRQETYEKFMEHMRFQDVNEITALRDLEYAQNSELSSKHRFGRLIDAYDKVNEDVSGRMMWDYASGVLQAPSTYIGVATGGLGKASALAGTQVAKLGVRKILAEGLRSATQAAVAEGAIGAVQGGLQELTRVETGVQEEFTGRRTAMTGLSSAAVGGLINFPIGMVQAKKASKANELYEQGQLASAQKANEASELSKEVLANTDEATKKKVKLKLDELDPTKVKLGRMLKQNLAKGETLTSALGSEVVDNISAAAIRVQDKLKIGDTERITSAISNLIAKGEFAELQDVRRILDEHNLTPDQFSLVYMAEISEAGRTLGFQSRAAKALRPKTLTDKLIEDVDNLEKAGVSAFSAGDAVSLSKGNAILRAGKDLDTFRLGMMTTQPATTMRNNLNGGMRMAVDAATRSMDNILNLRNPLDGTFDVYKYAFNPYEASAMRKLFTEAMPVEAAQLFREAADIASKTSQEGALATIGRKANFLNTASDNFFKRAVLSASLKRRLSDEGRNAVSEYKKSALKKTGKLSEADNQAIKNITDRYDLYKIIEKAEWNTIPDEVLKGAIKDSYEFTYQSSIEGSGIFSRIGRGVLNLHRDMPFVVSSFIPFPRYVANQLKFQFEYAPLIGMLPVGGIKGQYTKKRLAKQLVGAGMFAAAYQWRDMQGDTSNWYDIKTNDGNTIDGRAVYGPFGIFMLAADLVYRAQRGTLPTSIDDYVKSGLQATIGSTFRAGLGLYALDKFYQDARDGKFEKIAGELAGNIINTFTIPLSVVKDFEAQINPKFREIPETSPAAVGRSGDINFLDYMILRGGRSLPDILQSKIPQFKSDEAARSPFQTGKLMSVHPIEKQLFGFNIRPKKNTLQAEMTKLNVTPFEIYKRDSNPTVDFYMRQELSREGSELNLNEGLEKFIQSEDYTGLQSVAEKRDKLIDKARDEYIKEARATTIERIANEDAISGRSYNEVDFISYSKLPARKKEIINEQYKREFGGRSISQDKELYIIEDGAYINVMTWAAGRARGN